MRTASQADSEYLGLLPEVRDAVECLRTHLGHQPQAFRIIDPYYPKKLRHSNTQASLYEVVGQATTKAATLICLTKENNELHLIAFLVQDLQTDLPNHGRTAPDSVNTESIAPVVT